MPKRSAGLLMFRQTSGALEVLLVHPGGPFWAKKDTGAWFLPKGEIVPGEDSLAAAKREFAEETSFAPCEPYLPLGEVRQKSGKVVSVWAFEGTCDAAKLKSNTFEMEWPPRSGKRQMFPEVDRGAFFTAAVAREKMSPTEVEFLTRLEKICAEKASHPRKASGPALPDYTSRT